MTKYNATWELRWFMPMQGGLLTRAFPILQQRWINRATGESVWMGVPMVQENMRAYHEAPVTELGPLQTPNDPRP